MSIADLVYSLFNQEMYEYTIDGTTYPKVSHIPDNVLNKNVENWEVTTHPAFGMLYCLKVDTWNVTRGMVAEYILEVGFSAEQIKQMIKSGISLASITDITLSVDAVISIYTKMGYNKSQMQRILYEAYANMLLDDLNAYILNGTIALEETGYVRS